MSVIIRLQNLPWSANALDIREFFKGLSIPEGGVHIVGGELGDAFIAFSTDEDARLAMRMSGASLKGIQVTLLLSSRTEMQKVIEAARQQAMALQGYHVPPVIPSQPQSASASPVNQPPVQPVPQPPQPQMQPPLQPPPQVVPAPTQPLVPPPQMPLPTHSPYQMHGLTNNSDGHQPLPPMPPHMPLTPPVTMQQSMQSVSMMGNSQESPYNNIGNHENNDLQVVMPKDDKKDDKKPSSSSSSAPKRDSKSRDSRDSRRRRTRSRSRSRSRSRDRDRDRHRRHRSRSRSRSRDRGSRSYRRSRSRDRDRFRDKTRDRDRGRDRDRDRERGSRVGRDRSDRSSQDSNKTSPGNDLQSKDVEVIGGSGGIPGLGDIPSISMRGPLPSSLAEPIRNSPIQTPPGPVPPPVPSAYGANPPFNNSASPFPQQMPFSNINASPSNIPAPNTIDTPTDMELIAEDDGSLDQEASNEVQNNSPAPESMAPKPPVDFVGAPLGGPLGGPVDGPMRGPGEFPARYGAMPGEAPMPPQFNNRGPMPMRPEGCGYDGQPGHFPSQVESGNGPNPLQNFDPRTRPELAQRNWDPRDGSPNDPARFRGERDMRGFRGEKEVMNRGPATDRDPRENNEMRDMREENDGRGNWDPRSRMGRMEDFGPGWEGSNRQEGLKEASWNGRGRPGNFPSRNERDGFGNRNEQESWHTQDNWVGRDGHGRDQERYGDDGEYDENYGSRGYRGRGGRGWDRGRGWERGRGGRGGFRHGEYMDGHHDDGYGSQRGPGSFRGRGQSRWGGQYIDETCSVELHNVPLNASYRAIREIFQNIFVPSSSIKIIGDNHGNRTDVAYIRFSQPRDATRALKFSGSYIFDNRIEISLLSEAKYDSEVDVKSGGSSRNFPNESPCVYVTGVPMGCTEHNVAQVFEKFKIEDIVIERLRGTRTPSGGCFVRLISYDEAQRSIAELANASIDGSPLLIELCPPSAMAPAVKDRDMIGQEVKKKDGPQDQSDEAPVVKQSIPGDLLTDSVVIKRVPKDVTEANIRDFFSDEGLVPERMHFCEPGTNGVREVYVMFPLIEDAKQALGKNEQQIGKMKVLVELIAKPIVMNAMGLAFDPLELIKKGQKAGIGANVKEKPSISLVSIPPEDNDSMLDEGQDQMMKQDNYMEGAMMNMPHPNSYEEHQPFRGRMGGPYASGRGFMPRGEMRGMHRMMGMPGRGGMGEFGPRMRGALLRPPAGTSEDNFGTAVPPEHFGKPGCVVALGNLPYRCTTDDILDFLHEFPALRPEHIIRRYNEFNQPTADARVAFATPQEAQRVVQTHHRRPMDNRPIFVSLVQK
ncbi:uncharacterized protein LOC135203605 [Macrobrachium nipponense]|uniref:uncharacterized protein LOC135203605 n=1 Tax=Macrobrachium nipponense TaxID=159736 RepID=UPI0030C82746